jgi:hypothetical protein
MVRIPPRSGCRLSRRPVPDHIVPSVGRDVAAGAAGPASGQGAGGS